MATRLSHPPRSAWLWSPKDGRVAWRVRLNPSWRAHAPCVTSPYAVQASAAPEAEAMSSGRIERSYSSAWFKLG